MAGSMMADGSDENPVPLNVTPLVDIIFCLCLFFLCSFHFKQLEGRMESWLPKDAGPPEGPAMARPELEEIRIGMKWLPAANRVERRVNQRDVENDLELRAVLGERRANFAATGMPQPRVTIDAEPGVPWKDVVAVASLCRQVRFDKIEFAAPAPESAAGRGAAGGTEAR
ncbi:MAG: biopolymer transporter ExbD [Planctomycetes bacterium]|nr:biopolymer transporter ExbD [Planctomycetota bacterium]